MREIVLDTETTGFEPAEGHRLVEIGCVELMHQIPTGNTYHVYINPEREMPEDAYRVHGLSDEFWPINPFLPLWRMRFWNLSGMRRWSFIMRPLI